ncbi:UDP-glucose 4-epimerase [Thiothrix caldifontis]|uniref:UDP-glucose 4-epimerase n=1 Tax=Thiothrix caldifontis TaxID=525918 RepID=A0A1H4DLW7_9GAMM|nr:SDR family oxidoreductase [Thiothrix caldifontis]SEA73755.1 UDP-glucose 4-epimerase [Thiothrix caldifontis]
MILITGATGFVGSALIQHLHQQGHTLTAAVRRVTDSLPPNIQQIPIGDLHPDTDWTPALNNVDTIIHLAARVHVMHDTATDPLTEFRRTNTAATLNLAQQAATAGVRRLIYLSSIKVNGESTAPGQPFTAEETPPNLPLSGEEQETVPPLNSSPDKGRLGGVSSNDLDPYGQSKQEAEQGLREIAEQTGLEIVIIRPPLVYGAGVKANFHNMMHWLHKGIPLPLGNIHNQRSLVALPNLIDLITTCIDHPAAANQTFLVADGEDLSTTELLQRLSRALGKPARLLPIPQSWLETALTLLGKRAIAQRLCGNLQVDISKTRDLLDWTPPISVDEALRQTAQAYLQSQR